MSTNGWRQVKQGDWGEDTNELWDTHYPAILDDGAGSYLGQWNESDREVKIRLHYLKHPACLSMLALCFRALWTDEVDKLQVEEAGLFITGNHTDTERISIHRLTADGMTDGKSIPTYLLDSHPKMDMWIANGLIWRLKLPYSARYPHACNLLTPHENQFVRTQMGSLANNLNFASRYRSQMILCSSVSVR